MGKEKPPPPPPPAKTKTHVKIAAAAPQKPPPPTPTATPVTAATTTPKPPPPKKKKKAKSQATEYPMNYGDCFKQIGLKEPLQKKRLQLLVKEVLQLNPLEFMQIQRRVMYTVYSPNRKDALGEPMKNSYELLAKLYGRWFEEGTTLRSHAVDKIDKKYENSVGTDTPIAILTDIEEEKSKLARLLQLPGMAKICVCLWSHFEPQGALWALSPAFELDQEKKSEREDAGGEQDGEEPTDTTTTMETTTKKKKVVKEKERHFSVDTGSKNLDTIYISYLRRRYEPKGKTDEGIVTIFPFQVQHPCPNKREEMTRQKITFVVGAAWEARSLGEDSRLTFRLLHWAKQRQKEFERAGKNAEVYLLCDLHGHQEENLLLAQMLLDHVMDVSRKRVTFLGACRAVAAYKQLSWDNPNMLLFLQKNLLHWGVEEGVISADNARLRNWVSIYNCMLDRSRATPSMLVYDPHNLPIPRHLWAGQPTDDNKGNYRNKSKLPTDDTKEAADCNGIWRCNLGRAEPPSWLQKNKGKRGRFDEPAAHLECPAGFLAGWGPRPQDRKGCQTITQGMTTTTGCKGKNRKEERKTKKQRSNVISDVANPKHSKLETRKAEEKQTGGGNDLLSRRGKKSVGMPDISGSEFGGYYMASDIDHFMLDEAFEFSEFIAPRPRHYVWPEDDFSVELDKKKRSGLIKERRDKMPPPLAPTMGSAEPTVAAGKKPAAPAGAMPGQPFGVAK